MPIYDYKCKNGHTFEDMCSIKNRREAKKCTECGKNGYFVISVSKYKPTFGNADRFWELREKKRLGK